VSADNLATKLKQSDKKAIMPFQKDHLKDSSKHIEQSANRNLITPKYPHSNT
jgi:hypothetical protein